MLFQLIEAILCAYENKQSLLLTVNLLGLEKKLFFKQAVILVGLSQPYCPLQAPQN